MNGFYLKTDFKFFTRFFLLLLIVHQAQAQLPTPEPPPYEPQVLVGALPGDISVDNSGTANFNMPLTVPPGTAGVEPSLSISYNSRGGNGALGLGFYLSGLSSITCANDQLMLPKFLKKGVTHHNMGFEKRPVKGVTYECKEKHDEGPVEEDQSLFV